MNETEIKLELYKVMVGTISSNESRRQQINTVYVSLVAAGIAVVATAQQPNLTWLAFGALGMSVIWWGKIRYLRRLASAKFKVIAELENELPLKIFESEWTHMGQDRQTGFFGRLIQFRLTDLEMYIPVIIGLVSAGFLLAKLVKMFPQVS